MLRTERAVLIRYDVSGTTYAGSGLRVGQDFVLTADHCAKGRNHRVVCDGVEVPAEVYVRSQSEAIDLAVLEVPGLGAMDSLSYALVDRSFARSVEGCQALGFPRWKKSGETRVLVQLDGRIPTAEGLRQDTGSASRVDFLSLKLSGPEIPLTTPGKLDTAGSPWGGMSGAGVVVDGSVIGVVRSHNLSEGGGSLTVTPVGAIGQLPPEIRDTMLEALGIADLGKLAHVPTAAQSEAQREQTGPKAGKKSDNKDRASVLKAVTKDWVVKGTPVGVLQGFSGIGKTTASLSIKQLHPKRNLIDVEVPLGVRSSSDLLVLIGAKFAESGDIGVSLGSDPVLELSQALKRGGTLLLDDFHHCFLADTGAPEMDVQRLINAVSRRIRDSNGRILLVADEAATFPWIDSGTVFTLPGMSGNEGMRFLSRTLDSLGAPSDLPEGRLIDVIEWLGGNPRALQVLASCLQYDTLDDLIGLAPEAWELRDRWVDESLIKTLETAFLTRFIDRIGDLDMTLMKRLAVHRRSFEKEVFPTHLPAESPASINAIKRRLISNFLVERRGQKWFAVNPIARELALNSLPWEKGEMSRAHSAAGKHYARHFKESSLALSARGGEFLESRYHLHMAGEQTTLAMVATSYSLFLDRIYSRKRAIPEDAQELDETIAVLSAALDEASPSWRLHLYLARLFVARGLPGDLAEALDQVAHSTSSPNASSHAWRLRVQLTDQLHGIDEAAAVAARALESLDPALASGVYLLRAELLSRVEGRIDEAVGVLKEGIERVPAQSNLFSLYHLAGELLGRDEGRIDEAVELLKEGIGRVPAQSSVAPLYQSAAELLGRDRGRIDEAVELLKEGMARVPPRSNLFSLYQSAAELLSRDEGRIDEAVGVLKEGIERVPAQSNLFSLYHLAAELLGRDRERVDEAVELLKEGIGRVPAQSNLFSLYQSAAELLGRDRGRIDEAVELLREGIGRVPAQSSLASLYQSAAELLSRDEGRIGEAIALLKEGLERVPASGLASLYHFGAELLGRDGGRIDEAVELLREGIGRVPAQSSLAALYQSAAELLGRDRERLDEAVELLREGIGRVPAQSNLFSLYQSAAELLGRDEGRVDEAVDLLREGIGRVPAQSSLAALYQSAAELLGRDGDRVDEAVDLLREGMKRVPAQSNLFSLYQSAAELLGRDRDRVEEAIALLREGIAKVPTNNLFSLYQTYAMLSERVGDYDEALRVLCEGISRIDTWGASHRLAGNAVLACAATGDVDRMRSLQDFLTRSGHARDALFAEVLIAEINGEWSTAATHAGDACATYHNHIPFLSHEILALAICGDTEAAISRMTKISRSRAERTNGWLRAFVYARHGDSAGAMRALRRLCDLPEGTDVSPIALCLEVWEGSQHAFGEGPRFNFPVVPPIDFYQ